MSPLGVCLTYSLFRNLAFGGGASYNKLCLLTFLTKKEIVDPSRNSPVGLSSSLVGIEKKEGLLMELF